MKGKESWKKIFDDHNILKNNFDKTPFIITADDIKKSVQNFKNTNEKEVRVLCTQTKREDVPEVMAERGLFLLPIKNGKYAIIKGEGYLDISDINKKAILHKKDVVWDIETSNIGDSEMQHIDYAYAVSVIRTFVDDNTLIQTIRGRKYTPKFNFFVGKQKIEVESVQTEVDAGYEGETQIVLIEGKNSNTKNTIIRQLYYPFRQWSEQVPSKKVRNIFFEKRGSEYLLWEYEFTDKFNYNSIKLVKSNKYKIV